jgi:hypothetical protein
LHGRAAAGKPGRRILAAGAGRRRAAGAACVAAAGGAFAPARTPTHPVEPDRLPPESGTAEPNPTQLPVEPEFGPALPPAEPEDPGVQKPTI